MKIVGPQDKKEKNKSATPNVAEIRRRALPMSKTAQSQKDTAPTARQSSGY